MPAVTVRVTEEGIVIPNIAAQILGYAVDDWAEVEIRRLPSTRELKGRALHYILHHLGDAVGVGTPTWTGENWRIPLLVKGRVGMFGQLTLNRDGEVIEALSTSRMELREAISASSSSAAPA